MASKTTGKKKGRSSANPSSYSEIYKSSAANVVPAAAATSTANPAARQADVPVAARTATSDTVDWKGEYGYVLADLRYLGIVTAVLVLGIVVVGFFL